MGPSVVQVRVQQLNFLLTGIFTTVCNQVIFNQGGAEQSTLLLSMPSYIGMMLIAIMPEARQDLPVSVNHATLTSAAIVDVAANIICIYGLQLVGSGMYQVLYSSVVLFAALMTRFILGKEVQSMQWLGIIIMAIGLATTSIGGHLHHSNVKEQLAADDDEMVHIMYGVVVTAVGCIGYASSYVLGEYVLSKSPTLPPQRLCVQVGSIGTMLISLHFATHTIPKWEPLVTKNIERKGGDSATICCLYAGLVVSSFMHNWAHFYLLRSTGAVSTGVLQSLRSIGVFAVSGWLFCDSYPTQCMTSLKSLACLIVSTGVLVYSYGSFISTKGACGGGALPDAPALSIPSDGSTLYDHENPHPMSPGCAGDGGKGSLWGGSGAAGDEHGGSRTPRRKGGGVGWLMRAVGMGSASAEFDYASAKKSEDGAAEMIERRNLGSREGSDGELSSSGGGGDVNPAVAKRSH